MPRIRSSSAVSTSGSGSSGAPLDASFVVLGLNPTLTNERVLTGTSNQVVVTDNGAGGTVVLSLPQSIHTGASPTFVSLTLSGLGAGGILFPNSSGVITQDVNNLFWNDTDNRLAVGTGGATAQATVHAGSGADTPGFGTVGSRAFYGTFDGQTDLFLRDSANDIVSRFTAGPTTVQFGSATNHSFEILSNNTIRVHIENDGRIALNNSSVVVGSIVYIAPTAGSITLRVNGADNQNTALIQGSGTTSQSYGPVFAAGTNSSDRSFLVRDASNATGYLYIRGDGLTVVGSETAIGSQFQVNSQVTTRISQIIRNIANQTASALEVQNSSGTAYVTIGPSTLAGDTSNNWLTVIGTVPATRTASTRGINIEVTGAGSSNFELDAMRVILNAGYTGASYSIGVNVTNLSAGTGTSLYGGTSNYGVYLQAIGSTTGYNTGFHGEGGLGNVNIGVSGIAVRTKASAVNIGIMGAAINAGASSKQVGGFFILRSSGTEPVNTPSAGIVVDNGAQTDPIAIFQDNAVTVWSFADGGTLTAAEGSNIVVGTSTGTKIGTAATQKLGFWGATPVVQDTGWSVSNVSTDRSFNAAVTTLDEIANVLGTLITKLLNYGFIGA